MALMVKGTMSNDWKLSSEDKARKEAQRERSAAAALTKQLGDALQGSTAPAQQQPAGGKHCKTKKSDEVPSAAAQEEVSPKLKLQPNPDTFWLNMATNAMAHGPGVCSRPEVLLRLHQRTMHFVRG